MKWMLSLRGLKLTRAFDDKKAAVMSNTCKFWDCDNSVDAGHFYCYTHHQDYQNGRVDECSECGRSKYVQYPLCFECHDKQQEAAAMSNKCKFWDCDNLIRAGHFYCYRHYQDYRNGGVDECSECGRGKDSQYDLCLECFNKQPSYRREYSDAWEEGDAKATKEFYVYILKLDGGKFYAGQTREIRERLMEHRDGTTMSTAGKNPKLVWFTTVSTRDQATELEVELKRLCDKNPREIRRRVRRFQDIVTDLDST